MPTSKAIPKVSRWLIFKRMQGMLKNPIPYFSEYEAELGDTYMMHVGGIQRSIISSNPDFMQHVLQKNNKNYAKSPIQTDILGAYVGMGLLTSNGDYWLRQRRLIQPGFHRQKLAGLVDIMHEEIVDACAHFEEKAASGAVFDINEDGMAIAFRVVAKSLFGSQIDQQEMKNLADGIAKVQEFIIQLIRIPFKKPWLSLTGQVRKHKAIAAEMGDLLTSLIVQRRESGESKDDLLDMLLNVRYEDTNEGMTDLQLKDESLILFVAGHETTANAIAWTFYLLSQHPEVVTRLREEMDKVLGTDKPSFDNLRQLEYTTQVINESMRLYPPAWLTDRVALDDDVVNGFEVKKGDFVISYIYGAHHSKELWEAVDQFNPDRFNKSNKKERHPYAFLPFGGGPRLCIGNSFAMMEMQIIIAELIRKYDFELLEGQEIEAFPLITLRPKNGIKMRVKKI